jgi:AcrR family transcriptional regulator
MLRQRIIDISSELFQTFGLKTVSMDDIAKKVGISKRTLYETFSSKDELLTMCLSEKERRQAESLMQIIEDKGNDFVDVIVKVLIHLSQELRKVNPLFFQDLDRYNFRMAFEEQRSNTEGRKQSFMKLLNKGIEEGYIRSDIDLSLTVDLFMGRNSSLKSYFSSSSHRIENVLGNMYLIYFRGISTIKGIERIDKIVETQKIK